MNNSFGVGSLPIEVANFLELFLDMFSGWVFVTDRSGLLLFASNKAFEFINEKDNFLRQNILFYLQCCYSSVSEMFVANQQGQSALSVLIRCRNGELVAAKVTLREFFGEDRVPYYLFLVSNIPQSQVIKPPERITTKISQVQLLLKQLERHEKNTHDHSVRVQALAAVFCQFMNWRNADVREMSLAGSLHDIGKLRIPVDVLNRTGDLHAGDLQILKTHPSNGAILVSEYLPGQGNSRIIQMVRHHHENFNGQGYPDQLVGDKIPLGARILRIIDSFDAMNNHRPHREKLPVETAISELLRYRGTSYDADLVDAFVCFLVAQKKKSQAQAKEA